MENDRESGGTRPLAVPAPEARELKIRLALAERAIAESASRIAELSCALAEFTGVEQRSGASAAIFLDADSVSPFALGFYNREFDKLGRPFRWTGKSDIFEIRLRLNRNAPWTFAMEVQANPNVDTRNLRGFVDYIEVPIEADEAGKFVTGSIPERYFGMTATLTFLLPNTYIPSIVNPSVQDNRTLGLIFYELRASTCEPASGVDPDDDARPEAEEAFGERDEVAPRGRRRAGRRDAETTS